MVQLARLPRSVHAGCKLIFRFISVKIFRIYAQRSSPRALGPVAQLD